MGNFKAQSFNKILITCLVLFVLALALTSYSAKNPDFAAMGTSATNGLLRPFQTFHRWIFYGLQEFWGNYIYLINTKQQNIELVNRLAVLESQNSRLREIKHENERLQGLLKAKQDETLDGIVATVIAHDPSNWSQSITISRGSEDGILPGDPVLVGDGLVGQVVASSRRSARVLLITDPSSGVDALLQDGRVRGVVNGTGRFQATWDYVLANEQIKIGDRVVTSGMDGVYPKGLFIGVVSRASREMSGRLFSSITVKPAVDFTNLENVFVIKSLKQEKSDSLAIQDN